MVKYVILYPRILFSFFSFFSFLIYFGINKFIFLTIKIVNMDRQLFMWPVEVVFLTLFMYY